MAKETTTLPITSFTEDWGCAADGKPHSVQQMREFLGKIYEELSGKGGGINYFRELLDVVAMAFGTDDSGKTVVWNGTEWVKGTAGDKITKAAIEAVLIGTITSHNHDGVYQPVISDLATIIANASHGNTAYGWGNHANAGYLITESDPVFKASPAYELTKSMVEVLKHMTVDDEGNIKFDTNLLSTGGVTAYTTSDRRLKKNIEDVDALAEIEDLGGVKQFDYKDTGKHSVGLIAQEVQKSAYKDAVYEKEDKTLAINYLDPRFISLALGGVEQLKKENEELKARVARLEGMLNKLMEGK